MAEPVFDSEDELRQWLEAQQKGYGTLYARQLFQQDFRSVGKIASFSAAELEALGLSKPAAANLRRRAIRVLHLAEVGSQLAARPDSSMDAISSHLWTLPEPSLPQSCDEVTQWMFEQQSSLKIPVLSIYYRKALQQLPQLALQHLVVTDSAIAAMNLSSTLELEPPSMPFGELDTSVHIISSIKRVWGQLQHSPKPLLYSLSLNNSKKASSHSSFAQKAKRRPDTMVIVNKCTLLLGEDRHCDLQGAFRDLSNKRATLLQAHYRGVQFLLGYAAAGTSFQWCFLHADADKEIKTVGPQLDLRRTPDRWKFLLSWVQAYRLLTVMAEKVAPLQGRLALYEIINRGPGRQVQLLGDTLRKTVEGFEHFASQLRTSFATVCQAYAVAGDAAAHGRQVLGHPFLITSTRGPALDRRGCYSVTTTPCGYDPVVNTEQDLHSLAVACCYAAQALHSNGLVHRDMRLPNVTQLGPGQYMVIDVESAAKISREPLPHDFTDRLCTCTPSVLDESRCFTPASDLYLIGKMLDNLLRSPSAAADSFISGLLSKSWSAQEALHQLQHVWQPPRRMEV